MSNLIILLADMILKNYQYILDNNVGLDGRKVDIFHVFNDFSYICDMCKVPPKELFNVYLIFTGQDK